MDINKSRIRPLAVCCLLLACICSTVVGQGAQVGTPGAGASASAPSPELLQLQHLASQVHSIETSMRQQYSTVYHFIAAVRQAQDANRVSADQQLTDIITRLAGGIPAVSRSVGTVPGATHFEANPGTVGTVGTTGAEVHISNGVAEPSPIDGCHTGEVQHSGIYMLKSTSNKVFCDAVTNGGGWTVIQRRQDGSVNFYRNWNQYKAGFGSLEGEFFYGIENTQRLLRLGRSRRYRMRIDMLSFENAYSYAEYDHVSIGSENENYPLSYQRFSGTASNSLPAESVFGTFDRHTQPTVQSCATHRKSGFWFPATGGCGQVNLNGVYRNNTHTVGPTEIFTGTGVQFGARFGATATTMTTAAVSPFQVAPRFGHVGTTTRHQPDNIMWLPEFGGNSLMKVVEMKIRPMNYVRPTFI